MLHKSEAGFVTRPSAEVEVLLTAAYGADMAAADLLPGFDVVARSLNRGELARAMIAAVLTRLPELSWNAAVRLANAEERLSKYNPDEPRDWRGRWTADYGADAAGQDILPEYPVDLGSSEGFPGGATQFTQPQSILSQDDANGEEPEVSSSPLERKYDDLGPVPFAKQVIQFGDFLGREGQDLSPDESQDALAEYNFLQDRLSFWLAYGNKPPEAQPNLISAALTLYEGAVNAGIVPVGGKHGDIPQSLMVAAAGAILLDDSQPGVSLRRPSVETGVEQEALPPEERSFWEPSPKAWNNVADNADIGIDWDGGISDKGLPWEAYNALRNPDIKRLAQNSKTFDAFNEPLAEAISDKVLDPLRRGGGLYIASLEHVPISTRQ